MSRLRVGDDDHADAAGKHWEDVKVLADASPPRHDGAGYLSGYVVECALKAIILHDKSYDSTVGAHDRTKLRDWHRKLRTDYRHDLLKLALASIGPEGAKYMPHLPTALRGKASIFEWKETLRYSAPGAINEARAQSYREWAEIAIGSIMTMRMDGVL